MKNIIFIMLLSLLFSCSKDLETNKPLSITKDTMINKRSGTELNDPNINNETVLGAIKNNPFEINNLNNAANTLCSANEYQVMATDHLIKFPNLTAVQLNTLGSDDDLLLFDYPMNYRVEEMGDYYLDPSYFTEGQTQTMEDYIIPPIYTICSVDHVFDSNINYEVIEAYNYNYSYPDLIVQSFLMTGNIDYVNDYIGPEDFAAHHGGNTGTCTPRNPPIDCPEGCYPVLVEGAVEFEVIWICECTDRNGGTSPPQNNCGCQIPADPKIPAGCVEVEINGNNTEGVRNIQVLVADNLLQLLKPKKTFTNAGGCWNLNRRMSKNIWVYTKFQNQFSAERSARTQGAIWQLLIPIKDYIGKFDEPHNNIYQLYEMASGGINLRTQHVLWGAATANNQVQDFNDLADANGINPAPDLLDIYMVPSETRGSAIMAKQSLAISSLLSAQSTSVLPDLFLGIDDSRRRQNFLAYHELAHASHFSLVGPVWWLRLVQAEVQNTGTFNPLTGQFAGDPYGNGNNPLDSYIAVAESWAEHLAETYGNGAPEDLLFENGYIPEGLYHDLIDNVVDIGNGITDNVNGYTPAEIFNNLDVISIPELEARLFPLLPAGNNLADYNLLFTQYQP